MHIPKDLLDVSSHWVAIIPAAASRSAASRSKAQVYLEIEPSEVT